MQSFDKLFKVSCGYRDDHSLTCLKIANKIEDIYDHDGTIDQKYFTDYLEYLDKNKYGRCNELNEHHNLIVKLLETMVPSTKDMNYLLLIFSQRKGYNKYDDDDCECDCDYDNDEECECECDCHCKKPVKNTTKQSEPVKIMQKLVERKITILPEVLCNAIKNNMRDVSEFLVKHVEVNAKCIEEACLYGNIEILPQMLGQKIKATTKSLENLLQYYMGKAKGKHEVIIHQMNLLLKYGAEPNRECLIKACYIKYKSIIEKILSYKIEPNKKCFDTLIGDKLYHGRIQQAKDADLVVELINLLIAHGYKLTLKDVTHAMEQGYYVSNIKQYDFKLDQKFVDKCYKTGYFPYKDLDIKPSMDCLRAECRRSGNIKNIRQLVKQGLEPDISCLRDACRVRTNQANIKYLVEEKKIKPDLQCLQNMALTLGNASMKTLLANYIPADDKTVIVPPINDDESDNEDKEDKEDNDEESKKKSVKVIAKRAVKKRIVKKAIIKKKSIMPVDDDSISEDEENIQVTNKIDK